MLAKIMPHKMQGDIKAIPSKSYAHRILLSSMLANATTKIVGALGSKDVEATLNCVKALGCKVLIKKDLYVVTPKQTMPQNIVLDCIESGSTLRFILPIICALGINCTIVGREGLAKRPLDDLLEVLRQHGAEIEGEKLPIKVSKQIISGEYRIRGDISSQYITGLLMALPLLSGDSKIIIEGNTVSSKYIDITLDVLTTFGISIETESYGYSIKGNQKYNSPGQLSIQGDWSNAAFWLTLGAINGNTKVEGLSFGSVQGDREIVQILMNMGAKISIAKDIISVEKSKLSAIDLDAANIPDLVPIVSVLMANAEGISIIKNVDRLRIKETDRLQAIMDVLKKMGIKVQYKDKELLILGGKIGKFEVDGYNDHRMVMTEAIAASIATGDCVINGAEAISKSYPTFFEDYKKLGGIVSVK